MTRSASRRRTVPGARHRVPSAARRTTERRLLAGWLAAAITAPIASTFAILAILEHDDVDQPAPTPTVPTPEPPPPSPDPTPSETRTADKTPDQPEPVRTKPEPEPDPVTHWTAPEFHGIAATGTYEISAKGLTSSLTLKLNARTDEWAVFIHQHFDGGELCDSGANVTKGIGSVLHTEFGSRCTKVFRVRLCFADRVESSPNGTAHITPTRCSPWRRLRG
ncbi:hypothetical protein [Spirillospora sp. CA-294931]|uniref:hypothetical protein n=1 Tax=Spirillospora sp. CA-294931 TaxID=3240042 RepID=UPI003D90E31B